MPAAYSPAPPRKKLLKAKTDPRQPTDVFLCGEHHAADAPLYHPCSGLTGIACSTVHDSVLSVHDKCLELFAEGTNSKQETDFKPFLRSNPYIEMEAKSTQCSEAVRISSDGWHSTASTEHDGKRCQGSVVGHFFFEGVQVWSVAVNDLKLVTIGIVSALGVDELVCRDGSAMQFVSSLTQPALNDSLRISHTGLDGQITYTTIKPAPPSPSIIPSPVSQCSSHDADSVFAGEASAVLSTESSEDVTAKQEGLFLVKVTLDLYAGNVTYHVNEQRMGSVALGSLVGSHTVGVWMKGGALVKFFYLPTVKGYLHTKRHAGETQKSDMLTRFHVCGNPLRTWGPQDGVGAEASFSQPFGCVTATLNERSVCYVTDRNLLRIVVCHPKGLEKMPTTTPKVEKGSIFSGLDKFRAMATIQISLDGQIQTAQDLFLTGVCMCTSQQRLFICDAWLQRVLEVTPNANSKIWNASVVLQRGQTKAERQDIQKFITHSYLEATLTASYGKKSTKSHFASHPPPPPHSQGLGLWDVCYMQGNIFVTDSLRHCVLSVDVGEMEEGGETAPQGSRTSRWEGAIVVGQPGVPGCREGWSFQSRLRLPTGIACDAQSQALFVADTGNNRLTKIVLKPTSAGFEGCLSELFLSDHLSHPLSLNRPSTLCLKSSTAAKVLMCGEQFSQKIYSIAMIAATAAKQERSFFASPFERIIELLQGLKKTNLGKGEQGYAIDEVLSTLGKGQDIFAAKMVPKGDIDGQLSSWLQRGFASKTDEKIPLKGDSMNLDSPASSYRRPSVNDFKSIQFAIQSSRKLDISSAVYLKNFNNFEFDIFTIADSLKQKYFRKIQKAAVAGGGGPSPKISSFADICKADIDRHSTPQGAVSLTHMGAHSIFIQVMLQILSKYHFVERLKIKTEKLMSILRVIEVSYQDNPYHNAVHAADVVQTVQAIVTATRVDETCSALELFALFFAAAVHDFDHPGVSNQFLTSTRDSLAIRYNDRSILENYHVSQVFKIMRQHPACDFTLDLPLSQQTAFKEIVVSLVLATDMKQHFALLSQFKTRFLGGSKITHPTDEDKVLLFKFILHSSDISNPVKPCAVYRKWAERVMKEFREQGDTEKLHDLPYSPFCEPHQDIAKCQRGFMDFIVRPQYEVMIQTYPILSLLLVNLEENYAYWQNVAE